MAWVERMADREVRDSYPDFVDFLITVEESTATDTPPKGGQTYATVCGSGTLGTSSNYAGGEPRVFGEAAMKKYDPGKASVARLRFRGYYKTGV